MALGTGNSLKVRQGRKFGFTVGLAFLVLGGLAGWRGRELLSQAFGIVGGVLLLAALVVPAHLGPVERAWMRLAVLISQVTTPILVGALYFVVITPVALVMRAFGKNPI